MATPAAVLSVLVTANTSPATRGLMRFNTQLGATEKQSNKALGAVKTLAKGAAIGTGVGLGFAIKKAADFEQQLDSLGSVSGATGRQMDRLRKQAMKAGADTKFSALDAAEAQTELAKGGLTVAQIMRGGLRSALSLAAAGEMDLGEAAATTANALNLFGLKGKDSMKVADALAKAANATTADVSDFAMALRQSGGVAKTAGLSFTETVLALEALANAGTKNSDAGTSLKTALIQLIKPSEKQAELAKKLNLEFIDQHGNFKSLADVSEMLRDRLGGMTKAQRTAALATLAGTDGVRTLTALYDAGPAKLNKWSKGLNESGTAAEVAARKQDNLKGKLENLQGSIETIAISIGSKMLPTLTKAAERITDILNDPKLTASEKFDRFGKMIADAIGAAAPLVAKVAAKIGLVAVRGFFNVFRESPLWLKLLTVGFLLSKMGGFSAFRRVGQQGGTAMAGGIAEGAAKGTASGGIAGRFKGLAGAFKTVGRNVLGVALIAGITDAATRQGISGFGDRWQQLVSTATFGALPAPRDIDERLRTIADRITAWRGSGQLKLSDPNDPDNSLIRQEDLNDFTGRQRAMVTKLAELRNTATRLFGRGTRLFDKAWTDPARSIADLRMVDNELGRLRSGAIFKLGDITKASVDNFQRIARSMGVNTAAGRKAVQENFTLTVRAIRAGMKDGTISTRDGMRAIMRALDRQSGLGKDALGKNFNAVERHILKTMSRGGKLTQEGMAYMRSVMINEMQALGLSPDSIRMSLNKKASAKKGFTQPGQTGLVVRGGKPSGDSVHALLERGEVVINRTAVQKLGGPERVNRINQAIPRFQKGGIPLAQIAGNPGAVQDIGNEDLAKYHRAAQQKLRTAGGGPKVRKMIEFALGISKQGFPYVYGGGHNAGFSPPYDCSGFVSAILHAGGLLGSPITTDGLKTFGEEGPGKSVAVGVRGSTGRAAHTMIKLGRHYFESGSGHGASKVGGWSGGFPIMRHPQGLQRGGVVDKLRRKTKGVPAEKLADPSSPFFIGWGLQKGGAIPGFASGGVVAQAAYKAGFRGSWLQRMVAEAKGESGWNENAVGDGGSSIGLWQIHTGYNPWAAALNLRDPFVNARAAKRIFDSQGVGAWHAEHLPHMAAAAVAIKQMGGAVKKGLSPKQLRKRREEAKKLRARLKQIKGIGLSQATEGRLRRLTSDAADFADFAERASQLSEEGDPAKVLGRDEAGWLRKQLEILFKLRNALIRAHEAVIEKRQKVAARIGALQETLKQLRKRPKRNKRQISEVKKTLEALGTAREGLNTRRGELLGDLETVQGRGSTMGLLKRLPAVGVLGGSILSAQVRLRDLAEKPAEVLDTAADSPVDDGRADLLEQLLRESQKRTAVSEAHFDVFKNMPGFMGPFAKGGVALVGEKGPELAHMPSGTRVHSAADTQAMLAPSLVIQQLIIHEDGRATVKYEGREFEVGVQQVLRREARGAGRGLPSGGGWP